MKEKERLGTCKGQMSKQMESAQGDCNHLSNAIRFSWRGDGDGATSWLYKTEVRVLCVGKPSNHSD